jgi:peptidoglycan/xylan/chitin deacetylase (PgdA/CDA1 family)
MSIPFLASLPVQIHRIGETHRVGQNPGMGQEPWAWPDEEWREQVAQVRAGRPLLPDAWPDGARVAVAISFDSDHETLTLRNGDTSPGELSRGEYGTRVAAPRIMALLHRFEIRASFYMPAVSALLHPEEARGYVDAGHELGLHGWIHERNNQLPPGVERDLTFRAADALERITGVRPVGIRTPSWNFSADTLAIIRELGLAYDSSLMADDEPYEILAGGEPTGIVEIPVEWIRDDAPYFTTYPKQALFPQTPPRDVLEIWRDEFDRARAEGGLFQLTMHPTVIGHRSRIVVLEELLTHIAGAGDAWFATHAELAGFCLANC